MMTFRKLAANSDGKLTRAYLTEHAPEPQPCADLEPGARPDVGGRLTAYYTGALPHLECSRALTRCLT